MHYLREVANPPSLVIVVCFWINYDTRNAGFPGNSERKAKITLKCGKRSKRVVKVKSGNSLKVFNHRRLQRPVHLCFERNSANEAVEEYPRPNVFLALSADTGKGSFKGGTSYSAGKSLVVVQEYGDPVIWRAIDPCNEVVINLCICFLCVKADHK